jgi:hypothetical protein
MFVKEKDSGAFNITCVLRLFREVILQPLYVGYTDFIIYFALLLIDFK